MAALILPVMDTQEGPWVSLSPVLIGQGQTGEKWHAAFLKFLPSHDSCLLPIALPGVEGGPDGLEPHGQRPSH